MCFSTVVNVGNCIPLKTDRHWLSRHVFSSNEYLCVSPSKCVYLLALNVFVHVCFSSLEFHNWVTSMLMVVDYAKHECALSVLFHLWTSRIQTHAYSKSLHTNVNLFFILYCNNNFILAIDLFKAAKLHAVGRKLNVLKMSSYKNPHI